MNTSQMLKGVLEGCILAVIAKKPTYGYELFVRLSEQGLTSVSEGSIYPLLLRLQKEGLIEGRMVKSSSGPNRKYYSLTDEGKNRLIYFKKEWKILDKAVDQIITSKGDDPDGRDINLHSAK